MNLTVSVYKKLIYDYGKKNNNIRTTEGKTCGKLMLEWNAWADEHEHVECIAERISTSLIEIVKKQLGTVVN